MAKPFLQINKASPWGLDSEAVHLPDQFRIDLPAREDLVMSFTRGYSLLDLTIPDTGLADSTYRLRIDVESAMLEPTES
jgi:predicted transcriptional regulator of viral defense system